MARQIAFWAKRVAYGFVAAANLAIRESIATVTRSVLIRIVNMIFVTTVYRGTRENVWAMIEAEENEPSSSPEPVSPSEQEYWNSDESDSDAVEEADE